MDLDDMMMDPAAAAAAAQQAAAGGAPMDAVSMAAMAAAAGVAPPAATAVPDAASVAHVFGAVVPGRPVITDFAAVSSDKFVTELAMPSTITELSLFVLPGCELPPTLGVAIYWAVPPYDAWSLLGTLSAEKPSAIFRTGWATNPATTASDRVQLGLAVEGADFVDNLKESAAALEGDNRELAMLIATDLYNFMGSYAHSTPSGEHLMVPTRVLDHWMHRFETKYAKDATFLKKK